MKFFKRKTKDLNFSVENLEALNSSVLELKEFLFENGFGRINMELNNVLYFANKKDTENFRKHLLSDIFFGCSGALWELSLGNELKQTEFRKRFNAFVHAVKKIGINHRRINQTII